MDSPMETNECARQLALDQVLRTFHSIGPAGVSGSENLLGAGRESTGETAIFIVSRRLKYDHKELESDCRASVHGSSDRIHGDRDPH
jgi:hypothetical protein